ncbi:MAG: hypothetical protein A4E60_02488 [Syntrophorhabdus sp. PtaB.Bin047]|nr:MAG: hypothetical protein A4E60_02488 [Syntrophorhabdus sp. PtaB.Bin047]
MKIGFAAFRYAIAGFIIPYVMIYDQSILLEGGLVKVLIAVASCTLGVIALSSVVSRWLFTTLSFWEQALLFVGGILLIYPESVTSLIGLGCMAPVVYMNRRKKVALQRAVTMESIAL